MRCLRRISPLVLLAVCLWLPAESEAGYDTAFLTIMPTAGTPPFSWAYSYTAEMPPATEQTHASSPDPDESPQNALIEKTSQVTASPSYNTAAWGTYIHRFVVPSVQAVLSVRLAQPLPVPTLSQDPASPASSQDPFIEIIIPLEAATPGPPTAMHVQLLVPEKTILQILQEATGAVSASESALGSVSPADRIQRSRAFQAYLGTVAETLQDEATVQQYFRTASTMSSVISVLSTLGQIIALGTLPLHAVVTTIPMLLYYAVNAALGEDPQILHWKLFSSASNSILRTTFSDTLIPVP